MSKKANAFTIVELLIVIVVIAILAAISIVAYSGIQERARKAQFANDVSSIKKAMELYRTDKGYFPACVTTDECQYLSDIYPKLVPEYASSLPSAYDFRYVRPAATSDSAWGMRYISNAAPYNMTVTGNCKFGVNMAGWWWVSAPACPVG
mgnify:CR=1 FL=1